MKKTHLIPALILPLISLLPVFFPAEAPKVSAKKQSVTIKKITVFAPSGKTAYVAKRKKIRLSVSIKASPDKTANKKVYYRSKKPDIAAVSASGTVTGKKAGKTKIIVTSQKDSKKTAAIPVTVKKSAVTKIKLSSLSLMMGRKKKLKTTVSPKKNVYSVLTWTSSNTKSVTVKKGTVTAIAPGTSVITAKAVDGSGKKAKCKVTVTPDPAVLPSIIRAEALDEKNLCVTLSKPQALNASHFSIRYKTTAESAYKTAGIETVNTGDNTVYFLRLGGSDSVSRGTGIQVTVAALAGIKNLDFTAAFTNPAVPAAVYLSGISGRTLSESVDLGEYCAGGLASADITGLPDGLRYSINANAVLITGTPSAVCYGKAATISATDKTGRKLSRTVRFYIGDAEHVAAGKEPVRVIAALKQGDEYISGHIHTPAATVIAGGYGDETEENAAYKYAVDGALPDGLTLDSDGFLDGYIEKAGTYTINLKITSPSRNSIVVPVIITVTNPVTLKGMIRDTAGNPVSGAIVSAEPLSAVTQDSGSDGARFSYSAATDQNGSYQIPVMSGAAYDISCAGYLFSRRTIDGNLTLNGTIPASASKS